MRAAKLILNPVALVEAQAAAAVALAGEQIEIAVAIPNDCICAGDHLRGFTLKNDDAFGVGEFRFGAGRTGAEVAMEADAVFEMTADEIRFAVAVPIDERPEIRADVARTFPSKENWHGRIENGKTSDVPLD